MNKKFEELSSDILDYFTSDIDKILYKCHGNANIVFAIKDDKVIRAPKIYTNYDIVDCIFKEKIYLFIGYINSIKNYINTANIPNIKPGYLSNDAVIYLNKILNHRFHSIKNEINNKTSSLSSTSKPLSLSSSSSSLLSTCTCEECKTNNKNIEYFIGPYVFICDDATKLKVNHFPVANTKTYSIEIKPKQGWKIQEFIHLTKLFNNNIKNVEHCRYNAMQYTKLKNNKITQLSGYCPLDLFSGCRYRMTRAIKNLIYNPQNNFRMFIDGNLKNEENLSMENIINDNFEYSIDVLIDIIIRCLLNNKFNDTNNQHINDENKLHSIVKISTTSTCDPQTILHKDCVLSEILFLQKLAMKNMDKMNSDMTMNKKIYTYLKGMIEKENVKNIENFTSVEQYMIGATMLDCSIMITFKIIEKYQNFRPIPKLKHFEIDNNKIVLYEINLLDLDPKPDNHFTKYIKVTNQAYTDAYDILFNSKN